MYCCFLWASICASVLSVSSILNIVSSERLGITTAGGIKDQSDYSGVQLQRCFDRIIGAVDERQQDFVWTLDSTPSGETYSISVYSPKFKEAINPDADNLTAWFRDWQVILSRNVPCSIVTLQYGNVETSYGTVNIKPVDSPFRYLSDILVDGNVLVENGRTMISGVAL